MNARIASTLAAVAFAAASALTTPLSHAGDVHVGGKSANPHDYIQNHGKRDPYTDGARVGDKRDPYTDGARVGDKRNPFTDGARQGNFEVRTEGVRLSPAKRGYFSIQLAGRDLTGVSAPPGTSDQAVS
ncbi:hypothetical protein [Cupriavidus consociatus]|uniref:hypothetical protein n=1 Tax=Cupriavidus consociatus TaxID=2821357 RepID=UPI001AE1A0A0|nr:MULTISPECIES: hypothetical protein [unclassified Cupriavidus]MBP0620998.1 hypothetical protein [Cupriavidus sp. LEh25]MDK2657668.1 hypothetical protein [Cupriavidus sp. LEh21]